MKKINAKHGVVMNNPNSIFNYFGWPSVAKLPDGTLAAVASGFRMGHMCPFGKSVISYSRDEGETWTRPAPVIDTPLDDRDSGITCIGGNRVMITSFNNKIDQQRIFAEKNYAADTEKGKAAKAFKEAYCDLVDSTGLEEKYLGAIYCISEDGGYTFGEIRKVPVASIHGPCVTNDGEVLLIGYNINRKDDEAWIQCYRLKDDDTFEYLSDIPCAEKDDYNYYEPHAAALPDGTIIVMIRTHHKTGAEPGSTFCSISKDNGRTFSKPVHTNNNGFPAQVIRHSSGVLVAAYSYRKKPYGQRVMFSFDNGETWDTDYILRDDGVNSDLGYPCSIEMDDGSILTVYYQAEPGETIIPNVAVELDGKTGIPCDEKEKNPIIMYSKWSLDDVEK